MKHLLKLVFTFAIFSFSNIQAADLSWASKAVVKLFVTSQSWSVSQPWTKNRSRQYTCTGFFIKEGILTNGHCIADATYIEMEVPGIPNKLEARAIAVNHQLDIALLTPIGNRKLDIKPINFDSLPDLREKVVTIGYPSGGRQVSYTEGVVSRIDVMRYAHSNIPAPLIQTDAPINPGNSGGPVFSDRTGDCLGVSTQKSTSGEGQGYFIPVPIIKQFLTDIKDNKVDGIPTLGLGYQILENPASRQYLKLTKKQSGLRVRNIVPGGSSDNILQINDVLLEVDGHSIFNDGRVPFQENGRIWYDYYIATRQVGETIKVKVSRDGEVKEFEIELKPFRLTLIPHLPMYDKPLPYYVSGGLLYIAVEPRYFWSWGRNWLKQIPGSLKTYLGAMYKEEDLEELVVISEVFDASVNKGYSGEIENIRVASVNGKPIHRLADIKEAMESNISEFHVIELEGDISIVLDRQQVAQQDELIRQRYGIR
ncbi:MAG: trypsin-like peptidase domain-containing protein [Gammaproteobacteria bacterium]|nr:trypsin-like peptidase domain-containing protein [Gammaproteobacteria bacterium]